MPAVIDRDPVPPVGTRGGCRLPDRVGRGGRTVMLVLRPRGERKGEPTQDDEPNPDRTTRAITTVHRVAPGGRASSAGPPLTLSVNLPRGKSSPQDRSDPLRSARVCFRLQVAGRGAAATQVTLAPAHRSTNLLQSKFERWT